MQRILPKKRNKSQYADTVTANITLYAKWTENIITVHFDENKMKGWKPSKPVSHGDTVYENDELYFETTPSPSKTVDKWANNGTETSEKHPCFVYRVRAEDV